MRGSIDQVWTMKFWSWLSKFQTFAIIKDFIGLIIMNLIFRLDLILRATMDLGTFLSYYGIVELSLWLAHSFHTFSLLVATCVATFKLDTCLLSTFFMVFWNCIVNITSNLNLVSGLTLFAFWSLGLAVDMFLSGYLFPSKFKFALLNPIYLPTPGGSSHTFWRWHCRAATMGSTGDS
jgi:hypothetical protein